LLMKHDKTVGGVLPKGRLFEVVGGRSSFRRHPTENDTIAARGKKRPASPPILR